MMTKGNLVNLTVLQNSNLEISLVPGADIDWEQLLKERPRNALAILIDDIRNNSEWDFVNPEDIGALTDSTIISDGVDWPDSGKRVIWGRCWWFPNYMVEDEIVTLRDRGRVVFQWSGDEPFVPFDCELCDRQGCETCNHTGMILFRFGK